MINVPAKEEKIILINGRSLKDYLVFFYMIVDVASYKEYLFIISCKWSLLKCLGP